MASHGEPVVRFNGVGKKNQSTTHGWREEKRDLLQAVAGGAIVGIPLLFTMEMWSHAMTLSAWHLLLLLVGTLFLNVAFSYLSGFREETSLPEAVMESITGFGIAILFSAGVLTLIGELHLGASLLDGAGKVVLDAIAVSIGVSFAKSQIAGRSRTGADEEGGEPRPSHEESSQQQLARDLKEIAAVVAGSTVFALNVAPTEEISLIAGRLSPLQLLAVLIASTLLCYVILFASELRLRTVHLQSPFQHPVAQTILSTAISLIMAAILLAALGDGSPFENPQTAVASIVTLGLPAVVGGAAGRLIV